MTTLAKDTPRDYEIGDRNEFPVIAADIIYEGAAVGRVIASGHTRPLTSVDKFAGFAEKKADNSAGAAAAINVRVIKSGAVKLSVTGAVITDVDQPVYAQDDNSFSFLKASGVFIGLMRRYVSSGVGIVEFNAGVLVDPWEGVVAETLADNKTLDALDTGKLFQVTADAKVVTLPAVAKMDFIIACGAAYGISIVTIASNAADNIQARDLTATDDKDLILTKATANRGDYAHLGYGDATGWVVKRMVGTWVKE
jgi:hypothetical protein